jgi:hypothetical protein
MADDARGDIVACREKQIAPSLAAGPVRRPGML